MNNNQEVLDKKIISDKILLKEIDCLIENAKEIEKVLAKKELIKDNIPKNENNSNNNEEKIILERQLRGLKYILSHLEKNYDFTSQYHDTLSFENEKDISEEISKQIINLYINKQFNNCYNLWKKFDFKMLIGVSPERSFDMLKYLNKIRDRYEKRIDVINKINLINLEEKEDNYNNNSLFKNNKYDFGNDGQLVNNKIFNSKLKENEELTQKLKKQIEIIKRMTNSNK